jgi:hypothetical protein
MDDIFQQAYGRRVDPTLSAPTTQPEFIALNGNQSRLFDSCFCRLAILGRHGASCVTAITQISRPRKMIVNPFPIRKHSYSIVVENFFIFC